VAPAPLAHGFTVEILHRLVLDGLVKATPGTMWAADKGEVADDHQRRAAGARRHVVAVSIARVPLRGWACSPPIGAQSAPSALATLMAIPRQFAERPTENDDGATRTS
jgi:hypothetical protein